MARPKKNGLDYFPIDVDIFDDEKVIPVSSEFGTKGDGILIRVLCAIYRNGYYVEYSDAFIFKIAKQAGEAYDTVFDVISGLVKWSFFDKYMFETFKVLTSKGIQKRWMEATRKRVVEYKKLDFWLLNIEDKKTVSAEETGVSGGINPLKRGFLAEENPENDTESTQSKVKYSKVNKIIKEEEIKEEERPKTKKPSKAQTEKRFVPPTLEELKKYILEKNYKNVDAQTFINYYESVGWFVGKKKMVNWRAAVASWETRNKNSSPPTQKRKPANDNYDVNEIWKEQIEQAALKRKYQEA